MKYLSFSSIAVTLLILAGCASQSTKGRSMGKIVVGSIAPDFTLPDQNEKLHTLSSYRGHRVALYFYPKDETPGCTKEACSIRDGRAQLEAAGIVVLGVSHDTPASHRAFAKKHNLNFTLLSDTKKEVSTLYGAKGWLGMPARYTFLIDENGVVVSVMKDVNVSDHADEIIAAFQAR
jgi:thioredoxin-dependent peroxiredoxin